jgi:predicted transcriptional regulator
MRRDRSEATLAGLGRRERQIMEAVIRLGRPTANDVRNALPDTPSSSTVRTMLRHLETKGFLRHEWDGPRFVYSPTTGAATLQRSAVRNLMSTFFGDSIEAAVASMLGSARGKVADQELARVEEMIREARRKARRTRRGT